MQRDTSITTDLVVLLAAILVLIVVPLRLLNFSLSLVFSSAWKALIWVRCELRYWWGVMGQ